MTPGPNVGEEAGVGVKAVVGVEVGTELCLGVRAGADVDDRTSAAPEQAAATKRMPIVASH